MTYVMILGPGTWDGGPDGHASAAPLVLVGTPRLGLGWQGAYYLGGQLLRGAGLLASAARTLLDGERRPPRRVVVSEACLATLACGRWSTPCSRGPGWPCSSAAVVDTSVFGCRDDFAICGTDTISRTIAVRR